MNNIRLTNNRLRSHILTGLFASAFFFGATSVVSAATLSFSPSSAAIVQECQSSININVNISGQSSNAAEVLIAYNPAEVTILDSDPVSAGTQVRKGPAYDALLINDVNATTGRIRLVAGSVTNILSSTKTIATIEFLSNPGVSATSLSFFFAGVGVTNSSNDSNIADYTTSNDILTGVTNGSYTFYADTCPTTQDITPPQVTFVTPTPDETGVPLNTNIQIRITDAGGIALSSITFLVNNTSYDVNDPEVSYTGTSNDYLFTIDPAADLPAGEEIVVIAIGSDQSNNAFASQMSFNAPPPSGTDTDEPIVEFINPVANASNVPLDSNVSFRITDIAFLPEWSTLYQCQSRGIYHWYTK